MRGMSGTLGHEVKHFDALRIKMGHSQQHPFALGRSLPPLGAT